MLAREHCEIVFRETEKATANRRKGFFFGKLATRINLQDLQLTGNRIVLKDERMVLPATLQEIKLAHTAAHPGQEGLKTTTSITRFLSQFE